MGAAFAGISFWITDMQSSALNERIERMENRFAETREDHMKVRQDVAEVKRRTV